MENNQDFEQYVPKTLQEKLFVTHCQRELNNCDSLLGDIKQCISSYYLKKVKKEEFTVDDVNSFKDSIVKLTDCFERINELKV